jgi:hypothetical protein
MVLWPGRDRAVPARHQPVRAAAVRAAVGQRRHRVVLFAGAGAQFARETYAEYPPGGLNTRHGNAPTLRHLLAATTRNPGKVELAGYAVGSRRNDERIAADRVYLFTDATTGADAWRQAQDDYGILGAAATPDHIDLVDVPGGRARRPGCWSGTDGCGGQDCVIEWASRF